jgi:hypothetical protein
MYALYFWFTYRSWVHIFHNILPCHRCHGSVSQSLNTYSDNCAQFQVCDYLQQWWKSGTLRRNTKNISLSNSAVNVSEFGAHIVTWCVRPNTHGRQFLVLFMACIVTLNKLKAVLKAKNVVSKTSVQSMAQDNSLEETETQQAYLWWYFTESQKVN